MKCLLKSFCCAGLLAGLVGIASAAEVQGVLMDKVCSAKAISGGQKAAKEHDRECATAAACEKSGYGVFTADNKWLNFDAAGNEKAIAALKASKKADNLAVTVNGDVAGDTIKVSSLKLQ
jgi:hypothetical protein